MKEVKGHLVVEADKCRGCHSCQLACSMSKTGSYSLKDSCIRMSRDVKKEDTHPIIDTMCCDLCNGDPACVEACPYDALFFEESTPKVTVVR